MPRYIQLSTRLVSPALIIFSCSCTGPADDTEPASTDSAGERAPWSTPPPTVLDAPARLIGFSDVHGDFEAARSVLQLAGLIKLGFAPETEPAEVWWGAGGACTGA